jgi:predicted transcriptional regulator
MNAYKIQRHKDLRAEMKAVARGEKPAPADAARQSFESADVLLRLLTPENRILLRIIRDEHPKSVADLARLSKRAEPNLLRTLGKLEAFGLIEMQSEGRRRVPVSRINKLSVEIDLFSQNDRFEVA